jgi:MoaA/NifB/PqqE/SkfB family radical SAM enzyme
MTMHPVKIGRYVSTALNVLRKPLCVRNAPIHLILENTTVCPFNCIMCSRAREVEDPHHMAFDFYRRIIDEVDPLHLYLSAAGEPLLHPEQPEMIRYASEKGIKTCLVTTLAAHAFPLEELVRSGLDLLKVSMDGASEETYRRIRGTDFHPRVLENVARIGEIKRRTGSPTPFIRFQFVVQKENFREAAEIVRLARRCGVGAVFFKPLSIFRIEDLVADLMGGIDRGEFEASLREARRVARELKVRTNLDDFLSYLLPRHWEVYAGGEEFRPLARHCIVPWFSTFVRIHGEVAFCCYAKIQDAKVGSMAEEPFERIWTGDRYRAMRAVLRTGGFPMQDCRLCVPQRLSHLFNYWKIIPGYHG